jgi:hypothetical protein
LNVYLYQLCLFVRSLGDEAMTETVLNPQSEDPSNNAACWPLDPGLQHVNIPLTHATTNATTNATVNPYGFPHNHMIWHPLLLALLLRPMPPIPIPPSSSSACNIRASLALLLRRLNPAPPAPASSLAIMYSAHLLSSLLAPGRSPFNTRFMCSSTVCRNYRSATA